MLNTIRENIERKLGIPSRNVTTRDTAVIENLGKISGRYRNWRGGEQLNNYPTMRNLPQR
jgi:hypothetical protein